MTDASTDWLITFKPTFLNELILLPPKELSQVQKKIGLLAEDPTPDAKTKKQLKYWGGKLHRLRSGDFRVFYTFEQPYVSVLALRRRDDDTYAEQLEAESLGGLDARPPEQQTHGETWQRWLTAAPSGNKAPLPREITTELLQELRIPSEWHAALTAIKTEDDLLDTTAIPEAIRARV